MAGKKEKRTIGILGVPMSVGQPRGGTEKGPKVLRQGGLVDRLSGGGNIVIDHGDIGVTDSNPKQTTNIHAKNVTAVAYASNKISDAVYETIAAGEVCLTLGGDHSMAIGSIHGHAQAEPDLIVVWVDAHADINTPLTSGSGNIHGMPVSFLLRELTKLMPQMPEFSEIKPCISAKDIVYIGLRDVDEGEKKIIDHFGIAAYSMQDVEHHGIADVLARALWDVDKTGQRPIHVSFDVDSLDPCYIPSTGTPVPGGLNLRESLYLAEVLANTGRISAVDVAEVNPSIGSSEDVNLTVNNTILFLEYLFGKRRCGNYRSDYTLPVPK